MINHYDLSDSVAVLKKSEMYNVNTNVIFYMIFGFLYIYIYIYIYMYLTPSQVFFKGFA